MQQMFVRAKECSVVGTLGWLSGWHLWWGRRGRGGRRGAPKVLAEAGVENREWRRGEGKARR